MIDDCMYITSQSAKRLSKYVNYFFNYMKIEVTIDLISEEFSIYISQHQ